MKLTKTMMPDTKTIIMKQAEQNLLNSLPVDQRKLQLAKKYMQPKALKLIAATAIGGSMVVTILGSIGRNKIYRAAVAKELKKQLAPLYKRLGELEAQNEILIRQNEELRSKLAE